MSFEIEVARTLDELERLRPVWQALPWEREEAELDYVRTRLAHRPDANGPLAVLVLDGGEPAAGAVGRIEERRLPAAVGYRRVYAPRVRVLQLVDGGIVATADGARERLVEALGRELAAGTAEALALPALETGSPLLAAVEALGGPLRRQRFIRPWTRRLLTLPESFDAFLASRSHDARKGVRRDARRLPDALGGSLEVEVVRSPDGLERFVAGAERVARATYQRALGAGFADTPEQRALAALGLERGWIRGYLLRDAAGEPVAYWLCSTYRGRLLLRTTGYDERHRRHRPGLYLLMRVIEDAIADPTLEVLDFGPGDALYKTQFSNGSREERNALVFAPGLRPLRVNAVRTAVLGGAALTRRALDAAHLTGRVRTLWRGRLRRR